MPDIENVAAKRRGLRPAENEGPPDSCRLCDATEFELFIHVPRVAPSGQFIAVRHDEVEPDPVSMTIWKCSRCGLVEHDSGYPDGYYESYFVSYRASGFAKDYQKALAHRFVSEYRLEAQLVADLGCGDGIFLGSLREAGARVIGFERSHRSAETLRSDGFDIIESDLADDILPAPLAGLACRHVLEHVDDIIGFLQGIRRTLLPGGPVLIEVPSLEKTIEGHRVFDFFPEHLSYFSTSTLAFALERSGFESLNIRRIVGGEFLVATALTPSDPVPPNNWLGETISQFQSYADGMVEAGGSVALWGAGPKGLGLLSQLDRQSVRFVVDSDPLKYGRFTPTPRIPIIAPDDFIADPTTTVVITAAVYRSEIIEQLTALGYQGEVRWLGPGGQIEGQRER